MRITIKKKLQELLKTLVTERERILSSKLKTISFFKKPTLLMLINPAPRK